MYNAADRCWLSPDPVKGDIFNPLSMNLYIYCLDNPVRWCDPLGLNVKERYENELKNKLADPFRSVYLEAGLREAAIQYLHDQLYANGRDGTIELNLLQPATSREDRAVLGAVRKLITLHGDPIYDDYLYNRMQGIATAYNYDATQPYIINEQVLSYIEKFACEFQAEVNEARKLNPAKWREKTLFGQRVAANTLKEIDILLIAY